MLKARSGNLVFFGLSDENVKRLQQGQPIFFEGAVLGLPDLAFVIFHGKDEAAMADAVRAMVDGKPDDVAAH